MKKKKQFAVIGLGRFGSAVVKTLSENGYEVLACDKDINVVNALEPYVAKIIQIDVMKDGALDSLGLEDFDVVIIAIGGSLEACVMATMCAKEAGAQHIIAKAHNITEKKILEKLGADKVILPEYDSGVRLAVNLTTSNVLEYISFSDNYAIAEIAPIKEWHNKKLSDTNIRSKYGFNIVAIKHNNEVIISLAGDTVISPDDILVVIGENKKIQSIR